MHSFLGNSFPTNEYWAANQNQTEKLPLLILDGSLINGIKSIAFEEALASINILTGAELYDDCPPQRKSQISIIYRNLTVVVGEGGGNGGAVSQYLLSC